MGSGFLVIPAGMAALGVGGGIVVLLFAAVIVAITVGYEVCRYMICLCIVLLS